VSGVVEQQVPEGYKQTEVGVIPDDWECIESKDAINFFGGYGFSSRLASSSGVRWLKIANVGLNEIKWDAESFLPEYLITEFKGYELKKADVVMALTRPILSDKLKVARIDEDDIPALLNQRVARLDAKSFHQIGFLFYVVQRLNFIAAMNLSMAGTDPPNIGTIALGKIKIAAPSRKEEQTAIANTLTDVDALITSLEKLITKKRAIKTAAMQQLLTGKKRLPPFDLTHTGYKQTELGEIPEDWEVVELGNIGKNIIGLTYSPNDVVEYGSLVLRSSNVQNNKLAFENNVFVNMDLPERVIVREGDILVCVRNGSKQLIGKCALIDKKTEGAAFGAFMSIYRTEFSSFIFYQFQSNIIQRQIDEIMGATINQITNKDMSVFKVPLPNNTNEQVAIANVLSDMDKEIEVLEKRLHKTQQLKLGMMQELLTGRTRLL
jgi:type I restriction enzyme S subunit